MNFRKILALVSLAAVASAAEAAPTSYNFSMALINSYGGQTASFTGSYTIDPSTDNDNYDRYNGNNTLNLTAFSASGTLNTGTASEAVSYTLQDLGFFQLQRFNSDSSISYMSFGTIGKNTPLLGNVAIGAFGAPGSMTGSLDSDDYGMNGPFAYTQAAAAPVPEPGVWAMMASGLGLVGATAVRRRRRSALAA